MYRSIKKIHRKSESERKRLAFGYALVMTSLIAMIWGAATVQSFRSAGSIQQVNNDHSLFVTVKESLNNSIDYALQRNSASAILSDSENVLEFQLKKRLSKSSDLNKTNSYKLPFLPERDFDYLPRN